MSKQTWATLVYGRSYHLDFRFITVPDDFAAPEIAWASSYILATTKQARNLGGSPRWSVFKNDNHCVLGVTCMVRDVLSTLDRDALESMTKDEHGRPLYVFLGYVTQFKHSIISLTDLPAYNETQLIGFQELYREVEKVWLARDYDNRRATFSKYTPLGDRVRTIKVGPAIRQKSRFNNITKSPQKTFVWQKSTQKNSQLWLTAARCLEPTSVCLNIKGKTLTNSPFLNQTISKTEKFMICDRYPVKNRDRPFLETKSRPPSTIKQKISTKAKSDIDLTLQQAAKVTSASQEIINNLTGNNNIQKTESKSTKQSELFPEQEIFGLKTKKNSSSSKDKDWF